MLETKLKRILVPVEGAPTDEESLRLACYFAKRDRALIRALYIIEVRRSLPIDADIPPDAQRAEQVLENIHQMAERIGCHLEADMLQAREAGPAIVGEAAEHQADLIVMGVPYQEKFGDFCVESRALHVLTHAPCRVMLVREPLKHPIAR